MTQDILPQIADVHRLGGYGRMPYPRSYKTIFPQNPTQPNHLWASAKSVGGSSTPEISVNSVNSVGGLAEGGVGMAGMPYPPKCALLEDIPWGENTKRAWRNAMPSYVSYVDAWVWQGCHTLL